jgi:hypothetical protein
MQEREEKTECRNNCSEVQISYVQLTVICGGYQYRCMTIFISGRKFCLEKEITLRVPNKASALLVVNG